MTVSMYSEYALKFSVPSESSGGGFLCMSIYVASASVSGNERILLADTSPMGAIINPLIFISMSSRVSEKTVLRRSIAAVSGAESIPTAPIHNVSDVPIANNAGLKFPIWGLCFTLYPARSKMSRNVSKFIVLADGVFGVGTGATVCALCMVGTARRWGRCICGAAGRAGASGTIGVFGCAVGAGVSGVACAVLRMRARPIPMRRRNIPFGRISMYRTPMDIIMAHVNDI